jgi:hypothetical protein
VSFRRTIGLGAVTVIFGSAVAAGGGASCANAALPNAPSRSHAELEASNECLNEKDIGPGPAEAEAAYGLRLAVDVRRTDPD